MQVSWTEVAVPDEALLGKIRAGLSKIKVCVQKTSVVYTAKLLLRRGHTLAHMRRHL